MTIKVTKDNFFEGSQPAYPGLEDVIDDEILEYVLENHKIQIQSGATPYYLLSRRWEGKKVVRQTITSWDVTSPRYRKLLWSSGDTALNHPDLREQNLVDSTQVFQLWIDNTAATRVFDYRDIDADNEFALTQEALTGKVYLDLNTGYDPTSSTVEMQYYTICSCVNFESMKSQNNCSDCNGTLWGYEQHLSPTVKPRHTIPIREPLREETKSQMREGYYYRVINKHWTLATPLMRTKDIIIPWSEDETRQTNEVFEITNYRQNTFKGVLMHQEFDVLLVDLSSQLLDFSLNV